jgi:hypothetical protein
MVHPRAKLTPFGRKLLVDRVARLGWSVPGAAESLGVSRATAYKWLRRYREEGEAGLEDAPAGPAAAPTPSPGGRCGGSSEPVGACARAPTGWPRSSGCPAPPSTGSSAATACRGCAMPTAPPGPPSATRRTGRATSSTWTQEKPARVPEGGGHRMLGRGPETRRRRGGSYDYL